MLQQIFTTIGQTVTSFAGVIGNGFEGIISLFWNQADSVMTPLGMLMLIGTGMGLVYWAFKLVRGLIRLKK